MNLETEANAHEVFEQLKNEYQYDSDVTGGEFLLDVSIDGEYSKEEAVKGINEFRKWDGTEMEFTVERDEFYNWKTIEL